VRELPVAARATSGHPQRPPGFPVGVSGTCAHGTCRCRPPALTPLSRHACITIWAQTIANPKRVQALAGHASITMTLDRYGKHMNLGADETAAEVTRFLEKHGG
jgi:hypothetical protein